MRRNPSEAGLKPGNDELEMFTDREELLGLFSRHLDAAAEVPNGAASRLLMFYGLGGIGKTALVRKLGQEVQANAPEVPQARFDLDGAGETTQPSRRVLLALRSDLERRYKASFPRFDLCLAVLMAREGGASTPLAPLPPVLSNTFAFVLALAGALQAIPLPALPAAYKFAGDLVGGLLKKSPKIKEWVRWAGGTEEVATLLARALQDDESLTHELTRRFVQDLQSIDPAGRKGKLYRCVLFLDNYQQLWKSGDTLSVRAREADRWVRELAEWCLGGGVLLVLSGRERLRWEEQETSWSECLEQHQLRGLAERDAQLMLARRGIGAPPEHEPPSALQRSIIRCCSGGAPSNEASSTDEPGANCHPQFLALCADIVQNARRAEGLDPSPEMFKAIPDPETARELASLFLKTLNSRSLENWITELSATPRFDQDAALALDRERHHNNGRAGWDLLLGFSFVERLPGGFYHLHKTMQDALRATLPEDEAPHVHRFFEAHWLKLHPSLSWFHRWFLDPQGTLDWWAAEQESAWSHAEMAYCRWMLGIWADVILDEAGRAHTGDGPWVGAHVLLGDGFCRTYMVPRAEAYATGLAHYQAALSVATKEKTPTVWATIQNHMGNALAELPFGDALQNAQAALACFQAAAEVYTRDARPHEWAMIQNNMGKAHLAALTGDQEADRRQVLDAVACFENSLALCDRQENPYGWALCMVNLAAASVKLPDSGEPEQREARMKRAIGLLRQSLQVFERDRYPHEWALAHSNLGASYAMLPPGARAKNVRRSIVRYEAALNVYNPRDFPEPWANVQSGLGNVYSRLWGTADNILSLHASARCFENAALGYHALGQDAKAQQQTADALRAAQRLGDLELDYRQVAAQLQEAGFDPLRSAIKIERLGNGHLLAVHHHRDFYPACQRARLGNAVVCVLQPMPDAAPGDGGETDEDATAPP